MKDLFSDQSDLYRQFRPGYPAALLDAIMDYVPGRDTAWDCGTGNGQIARQLSTRFRQVLATDISEQQLAEAEIRPNIFYSRQPAEKTSFPDTTFDLVTVGQAVHWFDFEKFYREVVRTCRNQAVLAVLGYGVLKIDPELDGIIHKLYATILGGYWDRERRYIDEHYQTIPFPFEELPCPDFTNEYHWTRLQLIGYLNTWSAARHYLKERDVNPVDLIKNELMALWPEHEVRPVRFPLLARLGRIQK